jgi:hypothetical protein
MAIPPDDLPQQEPGWRAHPGRCCLGLTSLYYASKDVAKNTQTMTDMLCGGCPVFASCLSWSLKESDATFGRSAMTSPGDRRRYRRRWKIRPPERSSVEGAVDAWIAALQVAREQAARRARAVRA